MVREHEVRISAEGSSWQRKKIRLLALVRLTRYDSWNNCLANNKKSLRQDRRRLITRVLLRDLTDTQGFVLERDDIRRLSVPYV